MRKRPFATPFLLASLLLAMLPGSSQTRNLSGFPESATQQQKDLESTYDGYLLAANIDSGIRIMSARPHHVGSTGDKAVVDYIYNKLKGCGYDVQVETFYVPFPTPKERLLEMTSPTVFKATLAEKPLAADATSGQTSEQLPTYNCWSADGDVTGELVFVNYGIP